MFTLNIDAFVNNLQVNSKLNLTIRCMLRIENVYMKVNSNLFTDVRFRFYFSYFPMSLIRYMHAINLKRIRVQFKLVRLKC
jgi:hypothetical protein